jgi:uncharacterized protein (DUF885 family)
MRERPHPTRWICRHLPVLLLVVFASMGHAESLQDLGKDFWSWRAREQPFSVDDIPRLERPADLTIDWSPQKIQQYRGQLEDFERRFRQLADPAAPIPEQVDYRLLGSALARVHWELDINPRWRRDPSFYVDQTLGSMYLSLLPPPPFEPARQDALVSRLRSFPATIRAAHENLTDMRQPFAEVAIKSLADISKRLNVMADAVAPQLDTAHRAEMKAAVGPAIATLEGYRAWLEQQPHLREDTAIGRENYIYFLRQVALVRFTPEELLAMGQQELDRAISFQTYEQARDGRLPPMPAFHTMQEQMKEEQRDEAAIRIYLERHKILTVPGWMKHYRNLPLPAYVEPFAELGPTDDLTGPSRLDRNGTSYITPPTSDGAGFFATSHDPRPIILHEGVPGHYFQEVLGFANSDPIRTHYYDSGANEGIGFYAEEMMMQAGLFDDSPGTRQMIYGYMRLRALRVEVDVRLALGMFTLKQAEAYLIKTVPMDEATARGEATLFATSPGQAISYQMGKLQILHLLAETRRRQGDRFSLLDFHNFLWKNGNIPLSLQRWELLGDAGDVPALSQKQEIKNR